MYTNEAKENTPDNILTTTNPYIITYNLNDLIKTSDLNGGTVLIVINIKFCSELNDLATISLNIKFRYIIVVDVHVTKKCYEDMENKLYELKNYNLVIITLDSKSNNYFIMTKIPEIDEVTCGVSESLTVNIINICRNGSLDRKKVSDIFPSKEITDLKMCNLNVGMSKFYPYSMVNNEDDLKDLDTSKHLYGADAEVMKILAKKCNSTLKMFYIDTTRKTSQNVPQFIQHLLDGTLEVCAGGLIRQRVYGDVVAYSGIYSKQSVFWVYTVERDRRSWQSLVGKMTGLYVFLITYVCYVILWNILNQFDYKTTTVINSCLYGWGALLGASSLQDARSFKQKILNIMYLIVSLHMSAFVSTQIYYYLTIERPPKQFKTMEEISSSNKISYLIPTKKYFADDKYHIALANKSRDCFTFTECEELMLKHKASTILVEGLFSKLQSASSVGDEASIIRVADDILITYREMIIRQNSTLVKTIQKSILRLFEAGICNKLYVEAIGILAVDKAKIANKNILSDSYSCTQGCEITLSQSAFAFYVWIFGCCLSCFVFVFEILLKRRLRSSTVLLRPWNL
ncbi:uncharacterized protein LOC123660601 [Melitaea cinxia]|uniref:uncharacterized protein LOC123660601 n=1 Tax=Melitaea cinxia TaxID=113334 RepID=UPI001E27299C|nr:uncharacterized protein LOC123660601 [Melitaea cinxia]